MPFEFISSEVTADTPSKIRRDTLKAPDGRETI
jgi:hypothetical protein